MSESEDGGGPGGREVAYRLFAAEYDDADFSYSESDEERAPNYVVTPTGARANRVFVVGVLTETEQVNDDVLRARVVDPTGAFVIYAGQYQPDELAFLERAEPPTFVAVTGKARTFQPEDSDRVFTSIRPESINEVTAETRDRWTVNTAEQTLARVGTMADALSREERGDDLRESLVTAGVDEGLAAGVALAVDHYGTTPSYLHAVYDLALDAARVVAGERDEVGELTVAPDDEGTTTLADLLALETGVDLDETVPSAAETGGSGSAPDTTTTESDTVSTPEADSEAAPTETATGSATGTSDAEPDPDPEPATDDTGSETTATTTSEPESEAGSEADETAESEPEVEAATAEEGQAEPTASAGSESVDDEELGDFEPGEFELDEEEREEIEEEYGTEFSTGTEVDDPGEADIETPDPEELEAEQSADDPESEPATDAESAPEPEPEPESESESEPEPEPEPEPETTDEEAADDEAPAEDVDLGDAVMTVMQELNGDDGAPREELVAEVTDRTGAEADAVEDAIQDALMDGRCYEPDEETLKPI